MALLLQHLVSQHLQSSEKVRYCCRLNYLLYRHLDDQADAVTATEDTRSRVSDKVDVSEKSGESKLYSTDIEESSNSNAIY